MVSGASLRGQMQALTIMSCSYEIGLSCV
ncbi:hypothetical protein ACHAWF_005343 [Thalassiosira exigua]